MKQKIRCVVCKKLIRTTKQDVPRIATKPHCIKCYYIKKEQIKLKQRKSCKGTKRKDYWRNPFR
jgi:hypothetical protein